MCHRVERVLLALTSFLGIAKVSWAAVASPTTLTITSPTNGSIFQSGIIQIDAQADPTGRVKTVVFFAGTNYIGADFTQPFSAQWSNPPVGRYALRALAFDILNSGVESPAAHVQIGDVFYDQAARGPYLQSGTPSSIVVRWSTDWFCGTYLSYGTSWNKLDREVSDPAPKIDHEVTLVGLAAETRYYYAMRTERNALAAGLDCTFVTAPRIGTAKPVRIWAIGDSGTGDHRALAVRDGYLSYAQTPPDVWLMLGDNAYESGSQVDYQLAVFEAYPSLLRQTVLWPTIGNHDASLRYQMPFLDIFTLPDQGQVGGVPSGTERYYSFDFANIHFVCLDSDLARSGEMLNWLQEDLIATGQQWIIAFFHYPPYSKGTHKSDSEIELIRTRERVVPMLENYGVDLVLSGHSHNYERSYLLDGHYGYSTNLQPEMILNDGWGREGQGGPFSKPSRALGDRQGCIYVVCGCSGEGATMTDTHPAMRLALGGLGSMVIDVDGPRLDAKFIQTTGEVEDYFIIVKTAPEQVPPRVHLVPGNSSARLIWPAEPSIAVESATAAEATTWRLVTNPVTPIGNRYVTEVSLTESQRFFRLRRQP